MKGRRWRYGFLEYVLAVLFVFLIAVTFLSVVYRYIVRSSIVWAEEAARFLFIWICCIGAGVASKKGMHLAVDIVVRSLPRRLQTAVRLVTNALVVLFLVVLIAGGVWNLSVTRFQITPGLGIPYHWVCVIVPISGLIMLVYVVHNMYALVRGSKTREPGGPLAVQ